MANVRSIVDIDVKSEAFQEFQKRFDAYHKALAGMPAQWGQVGASAASAAQASSKSVSGMAETLASMTTALSAVVRQQGDVARGASGAERAFKSVARTTGDILRTVTDVTFQLVKWGAFGGILGIAAGGFGAGALAGAGADIRRTSMGYGVSPGQLRAARAIYGPQLDADALLSNIAAAQADPAKRFSFSALGITGAKAQGSPGDLLPDVIAGVVEKFKQYGGSAAAFNAFGLGNFMDMNTARELSKLPAGELRKEAGQYAAESKRLDIPDPTLERMKALNQAFDVAKQRIETVLIDGLARIAPNLEHLSDSIVKALETFMNNPKMGEYIDKFGTAIEDVATYLASDSFKQDINDFVNLIHKAAHPFDTVTSVRIPWSGKDPGGTSLKDVSEYWADKAGNLRDAITGTVMAYKQRQLAITEKNYGLPVGVLDRVWAAESSRGAAAGTSKAGAFGDFQFMPDTAKQYGLTPSSNWLQQEDAAGRKLADLMREYKGDAKKALAAYNFGEGKLNAVIGAHPTDWANYVPRETQGYIQRTAGAGAGAGVTVTVNNQTGGDSTAIATQVAH